MRVGVSTRAIRDLHDRMGKLADAEWRAVMVKAARATPFPLLRYVKTFAASCVQNGKSVLMVANH